MHQHDEEEYPSAAHGDICYERVPSSTNSSSAQDDNDSLDTAQHSPRQVLRNFLIMAVLLSANHGTMVSCLAFSTLQLGSIGAWQSSFFHLVYAASSLMGIPYLVKLWGPRNSMIAGMACYGTYVGCFALSVQFTSLQKLLSLVGAIGGGIGGALVWTAQGSYFGRAAQEYAQAVEVQETGQLQTFRVSNCEQEEEARRNATSLLGGVFAFIYLALEVGAKLLSWSLLSSTKVSWNTVLSIYTVVAILSTLGMVTVRDYPCQDEALREVSMWHKIAAAWYLLMKDAKMRYMVGLNAAFGFATPFVNSYVNGEVVHLVLKHDSNFHYVGLLSAVTSAVGALCSLSFGSASKYTGKGPFLVLGSAAFGCTALPFLIWPHVQEQWGWKLLLAVYSFQGIGRATFEGTLRATFADFFVGQEEGAFANIILQSGGFSALGFFMSFGISCHEPSAFCVRYKEGTLHEVLTLELMVVTSAVLAVLGYWRASILFLKEQCVHPEEESDERDSFVKHAPPINVFDLEGSESLEICGRDNQGNIVDDSFIENERVDAAPGQSDPKPNAKPNDKDRFRRRGLG